MKKIEKFQVAIGYMLFVRKSSEGIYVMTWSHVTDPALSRKWPRTKSSKIYLSTWNIHYAKAFINDISQMFGVGRKDVTNNFPAMELVIEFV